MIFKDDEGGNVIPCLFFEPWCYKANADDILIDTRYKLTPEETVDLIRKMEGHKFAFMFDRKEVSFFDYDIFKERKKFLKEIEGMNFTGHAKELENKVREAFKTIPECDDEFYG